MQEIREKSLVALEGTRVIDERSEAPSIKMLNISRRNDYFSNISLFSQLFSGGEGGIRTRQDTVDSVSYRIHNATIAADATIAVASCTRLHAPG